MLDNVSAADHMLHNSCLTEACTREVHRGWQKPFSKLIPTLTFTDAGLRISVSRKLWPYDIPRVMSKATACHALGNLPLHVDSKQQFARELPNLHGDIQFISCAQAPGLQYVITSLTL